MPNRIILNYSATAGDHSGVIMIVHIKISTSRPCNSPTNKETAPHPVTRYESAPLDRDAPGCCSICLSSTRAVGAAVCYSQAHKDTSLGRRCTSTVQMHFWVQLLFNSHPPLLPVGLSPVLCRRQSQRQATAYFFTSNFHSKSYTPTDSPASSS